ncbi:MAG: hypothetical protein ACLRQX_03545 [Turicibacter sanguinis]
MRDEVLGRFYYRMHQGFQLFTSNLDYEQLRHHSYTQKGEVEEIKGARILERIKAYVPVAITGTNYRQNR